MWGHLSTWGSLRWKPNETLLPDCTAGCPETIMLKFAIANQLKVKGSLPPKKVEFYEKVS